MTPIASRRALVDVDPNALSILKARELADFLCSGHREGVRLVNCCRSEDGILERLTIEVDVSVPQRPVYDIRPTESVVVEILSDDRIPPGVYSSRADFPYAPHTNLQDPAQPRSLCLYDQPWYEVSFDWNPARFLARIVWWLEETAHGSLHQADQLLEPLLFDSRCDLIIPSELLNTSRRVLHRWTEPKGTIRPDGTYTLVLERPKAVPDSAAPYRCAVVVMTTRPMTHGLIRSTPRTLRELDELIAEGGVNVQRELREIFKTWNRRLSLDDLPLVLDAYLIVLIRLRKRRRDSGAVEATEYRAFQAVDLVKAVGSRLGVAWHTDATGSPGAPSPQQQNGSETRVNLLNVREAFSKELARRSNGLHHASSDPRLTAIGGGALGSPILTNLTRSGYGQLTIIDADVLHPHNLARHALGAGFVGWYKAEGLAYELSNMMPESSFVKSIVANVLFPGGKAEELAAAYRDSDIILDMAASIPVSRHLVHGVSSRTRRVSLFLNPSGKALTLLAEDTGRAIPLDLLEMQFYRAIAKDPSLASLLEHTDRTRIGQTCRDLSAEISQDDVAMHGGMGSRSIRQLFECDEARIRTWLLDEQGNYRLSMDIVPATPSRLSTGDWTVLWDSELLDTLVRLRECRLPNETGGVLVGSCDRARKILYVVDALPSPLDSEELRTSYIRGTKGLTEEVERIVHVTASGLDYIGEWHSHPDGYGVEPSVNDEHLLDWIRTGMEERGETGLMCIIGEGRRMGVYL